MTGTAPMTLATLELEDRDLRSPHLVQYRRLDRRARNRRVADAGAALPIEQQHPFELHQIARRRLSRQTLDLQDVSRGHPILLPARFDDSKHVLGLK